MHFPIHGAGQPADDVQGAGEVRQAKVQGLPQPEQAGPSEERYQAQKLPRSTDALPRQNTEV